MRVSLNKGKILDDWNCSPCFVISYSEADGATLDECDTNAGRAHWTSANSGTDSCAMLRDKQEVPEILSDLI